MAEYLPSLPEGPELRLLVLGKTGNGKSMTGNVILEEDTKPKAKRPFESSGRSTSVTTIVKCHEKEVGGRKLVLVDTPGTMDTNNPLQPIKEISSAIVKSPEGYDAFLLVVKYGERLTEEGHEAINQVKKLFGSNFGKYAVLVMTGGDTFIREEDLKNENYETCDAEFQKYVNSEKLTQNPKSIASILEHIDGGCILFNNFEENPVKKRMQIVNLIEKVDNLRNPQRYTNEFFRLAEEELKSKEPKQVEVVVAKKVEEDAGCFPAKSLVVSYPGNTIPICEVKPGNQVLCADLMGHVSYQEVYMIGHAEIDTIMHVIEIKTQSNVLQISPGHYLPVGEKYVFKKAKEVEVGDIISVLDTENHSMKNEEVSSVNRFLAKGKFNPFTMNGFIIVDGVLASCYEESAPVPNTSHLLLAAIRGMYKISPKCLEKINEKRIKGVPTWAYKLSK